MSESPYTDPNVTAATFDDVVLARSHETLVLVDFWAGWCQPCQMLAPVLTQVVDSYQGKVVLAKVETDSEPQLAGRYGIRSLPTVKFFRHGAVVDAFFGVQSEGQIRAQIEAHIERTADPLIGEAAAARAAGQLDTAQRQAEAAVEADPGYFRAIAELMNVLALRGSIEHGRAWQRAIAPADRDKPEVQAAQARLTLAELIPDPAATRDHLAARLANQPDDAETRGALAARAILDGDAETGLETFLEWVRRARGDGKRAAQNGMLAAFDLLGTDHPLVPRYRRALSNALH